MRADAPMVSRLDPDFAVVLPRPPGTAGQLPLPSGVELGQVPEPVLDRTDIANLTPRPLSRVRPRFPVDPACSDPEEPVWLDGCTPQLCFDASLFAGATTWFEVELARLRLKERRQDASLRLVGRFRSPERSSDFRQALAGGGLFVLSGAGIRIVAPLDEFHGRRRVRVWQGGGACLEASVVLRRDGRFRVRVRGLPPEYELEEGGGSFVIRVGEVVGVGASGPLVPGLTPAP